MQTQQKKLNKNLAAFEADIVKCYVTEECDYEYEEIVALVKKHKSAIRFLYGKALEREEYCDTRSGYEYQGYRSQEQVKSDFYYISDRYNCAVRLRWLLDLIKADKKGIPKDYLEDVSNCIRKQISRGINRIKDSTETGRHAGWIWPRGVDALMGILLNQIEVEAGSK
jgi:hypothetical protein